MARKSQGQSPPVKPNRSDWVRNQSLQAVGVPLYKCQIFTFGERSSSKQGITLMLTLTIQKTKDGFSVHCAINFHQLALATIALFGFFG